MDPLLEDSVTAVPGGSLEPSNAEGYLKRQPTGPETQSMKRFATLLAGTVLAASIVAPFATSGTAHADTISDTTAFVASINWIRVGRGLAPLAVDTRLTSMATGWSAHMASSGILSHNPNLAAMLPAGWSLGGENVGYGGSEADLEYAFEHSPEHFANMVMPSYSAIGIGIVWRGNTMWVTEDYMAGVQPVVAAPPPPPTPPPSGYVLDGWGGLHPFGSAPPVSSPGWWPGWDIARGVVTFPGTNSGYTLDGWGGVHSFGSAPVVWSSSYWPGWDIARSLALDPCPGQSGGYVLDGWGGVHPFGGAPAVTGSAYWPGWDIARGLVLSCVGGQPAGYVLDGWGGLNPVGGAPRILDGSFWAGQDVARSVVLAGRGRGYVLDFKGGLHPFGGAPVATPYNEGLNFGRGAIVAAQGGGYVLDASGGVHPFGGASGSMNEEFPYWDIARGIAAGG